MIYSNILKTKYRNLLRGFVLILVSVFTLTIYSCQTASVETYTPQRLRTDEENEGIKILEVKTKTDSIIYLDNYNAKYYQREDAIICKKTDTTLINNGTTRQFKEKTVSKINLQNVMNVKIEKEETNVLLTLSVTAGVVFVVAIILAVIGSNGWGLGSVSNGTIH